MTAIGIENAFYRLIFFKRMSYRQKSLPPIFIVGCSRSGTTLLQSFLASHSEIASFPESKFFVNLVRLPEAGSRRYALGLVSPFMKTSLEAFLDEVHHPDLKRKIPKLPFIKHYVGSFREIMSELADRQGKSIWLEKTPEHLHRLKYIETYMPDAKIIHIVRNGIDVVASIYDLVQRYPKHWGLRLKTLDDCLNRWIEDIEITRKYLNKPNHTMVSYEKLIENPVDQVKRLCQFVDVPFDDQFISRYQVTSKKLIRPRETWKESNKQEVFDMGSKKFLSVFTEEQQIYVSRVVSSVKLPTLQTQ